MPHVDAPIDYASYFAVDRVEFDFAKCSSTHKSGKAVYLATDTQDGTSPPTASPIVQELQMTGLSNGSKDHPSPSTSQPSSPSSSRSALTPTKQLLVGFTVAISSNDKDLLRQDIEIRKELAQCQLPCVKPITTWMDKYENLFAVNELPPAHFQSLRQICEEYRQDIVNSLASILKVLQSVLRSFTTLHDAGLLLRCTSIDDWLVSIVDDSAILSAVPGIATYPSKTMPSERLRSIDLARMPNEDNEKLLPLYIAYSASEVLYPLPSVPPTPAADFFSFGIMLYESVTGEGFPPLCGTPPNLRHPKLPEELRSIIDKCIQNEPGDRYWCAKTLLYDLQHLCSHAKSKNQFQKYEIGQLDRVSRFTPPSQLYGREQEMAQMKRMWDTCQDLEVLCISGSQGSGKTALLRSFLSSLDGPRIYAKCDAASTKPFEAISALMDQWLALLLSRSHALCNKITNSFPQPFIPLLRSIVREDIFKALGLHKRMPDGPLPEIDVSEPFFVDACAEMLNNVGRAGIEPDPSIDWPGVGKIAIVTEDIQWLSKEDERVFTNGFSYHSQYPLLYVLSYRDDAQLPSIVPGDDVVTKIQLGPLSSQDMKEMITAALGGVGLDEPSAFITRAMQESGGNPHHFKSFLHLCVESSQLLFDWQQQIWTFRFFAGLKNAEFLSFVCSKQEGLKEVLFTAAAITDNGSFSVDLLALLLNQTCSKILETLEMVERSYGIVRDVSKTDLSNNPVNHRRDGTYFAFNHDFYQSNALGLETEPAQKAAACWHIGKAVLSATHLAATHVKHYAIQSIAEHTLSTSIELGYQPTVDEKMMLIRLQIRVAEDFLTIGAAHTSASLIGSAKHLAQDVALSLEDERRLRLVFIRVLLATADYDQVLREVDVGIESLSSTAADKVHFVALGTRAKIAVDPKNSITYALDSLHRTTGLTFNHSAETVQQLRGQLPQTAEAWKAALQAAREREAKVVHVHLAAVLNHVVGMAVNDDYYGHIFTCYAALLTLEAISFQSARSLALFLNVWSDQLDISTIEELIVTVKELNTAIKIRSPYEHQDVNFMADALLFLRGETCEAAAQALLQDALAQTHLGNMEFSAYSYIMAYTTMLCSGRRLMTLSRFPFPHLAPRLHPIWLNHLESVAEVDTAISSASTTFPPRTHVTRALEYSDDLIFMRKSVYHLELLAGILTEDTSWKVLNSSFRDDGAFCDVVGRSHRPFLQAMYIVCEMRGEESRKDEKRFNELSKMLEERLDYFQQIAERLAQTHLGIFVKLVKASYKARVLHHYSESAALLSESINSLRINFGFWTAIALEESAFVCERLNQHTLARKHLTRACRVYRQFGILCKVRRLVERHSGLLEGSSPQDFFTEWRVEEPKSVSEAVLQQKYELALESLRIADTPQEFQTAMLSSLAEFGNDLVAFVMLDSAGSMFLEGLAQQQDIQVEMHLPIDSAEKLIPVALFHLMVRLKTPLIGLKSLRAHLPCVSEFVEEHRFLDLAAVPVLLSGDKITAIVLLCSLDKNHFQKENLTDAVRKIVSKAALVLQPDAIERFCNTPLSELTIHHWQDLADDMQNFPRLTPIVRSRIRHHVTAVNNVDNRPLYLKAIDLAEGNENYILRDVLITALMQTPFLMVMDLDEVRGVVIMEVWSTANSLYQYRYLHERDLLSLFRFVSLLHSNLVAHGRIIEEHIVFRANQSGEIQNFALIDYSQSSSFLDLDSSIITCAPDEFTPPEANKSGVVDAFKSDIWQLGNYILQLSERRKFGFSCARSVAMRMIADDPHERPSIEEAIEAFELKLEGLYSEL